MAGSASPSLTSTSHTLTAGSTIMPPPSTASSALPAVNPGAVLLESVTAQNRHSFLNPPASIPEASLQFAKETLDAFAGQVSEEQQLRLREAGKKRKRAAGLERSDVLKIRKLHVEGFETAQVWEQAKRVITSALRESCDAIRELQEDGKVSQDDTERNDDLPSDVGGSESDDGASAVGSYDEEESAEDLSEEEEASDGGLDEAPSGEETGSAHSYESDELDGDVGSENGDGWEDEDEDAAELEGEGQEEESDDEPSGEFVEDKHGLNDGFFSIDEFNRQTQWFEDQDARANPDADMASDDEEVDWHADPMAMAESKSAVNVSGKGKRSDPLDESTDEDDGGDEGGPTFGSMDLDAPEGDSEDELDKSPGGGLEDGLDLTANDVFYKDFFAPPPRKGKRGMSRKHEPRRQSAPRPDEADVERAMNDTRRDLFDDLSEHSDSDDALSDASAGDPKSRRSAHERRQAKLAEEIRKLEAESVAKRAWTLSGEAAAVDRPINSLLEEDLDFEHAGKPVPVITEEVSESIEELIKRRILAQEFDDILRRRPGSLADGSAGARRGLAELDDSKAQQSLAEIYEEEHVKKANPDAYVSKEDEKLQREEREVERMWKEVSAKLDALSSWHYKPRPAEPSLTVLSDVATISMEDAQPTTAQGVGGSETVLAPQEVYRAGKETAEQGEVVAKSGLPVARQEMSREEKLRRRRREKERLKKSGGGQQGRQPLGKKAQEQKDTLSDLKKGGVRVINKKGEIVDLEGKKAAGPKASATSGSFKL